MNTPEMPPSCRLLPPSSPGCSRGTSPRQFHFTAQTHPAFDVSSTHPYCSQPEAGGRSLLPEAMIARTLYPPKKPWNLPEPPYPGELSLKDWGSTKQAGKRGRPGGATVFPVTTGGPLGEGVPKSFQQLAL